MIAGKAKIARAKCGFAEVDLRIDPSGSEAIIEFLCSGSGFTSQGGIEEAPSEGYGDWKSGARVGLEFALASSGATLGAIFVDRIAGLSTDTNPTVVAVAAAHALWNALGFAPSDETSAFLEAKMREAWGGQRPTAVPGRWHHLKSS